ncbi:metallophosphoesterase [Dysgonomonas sp. Marseille-P4677]|uniref:metallophosphoesterase n=1 Tax=Dysgonomonas sp. Marseille-P4677 TaxID=2364790 RepID=UPI001914952D|nr:metallophosphoesterase [Dysgonomonas sp. Marseille-P4677]MBK5720523.1 metallophosphoesterase [Dysgonomonas sp. Marseille-P4677]
MKSKNVRKIIILTIFILTPCLCVLYGYFEARHIVIKKITFSHNDIPESFNGKKIIFISDIHCDNYFPVKKVADLVDIINERNPDIIIIGGDNVRKDTTYFTPFFKEISNLKSKYGVYTVLGNHDHWEDPQLIQQGFRDCKFYICDNQGYWIKEDNDSIRIGGVGDFWEDKQLLENTTQDVKKSDFCILLSHNPDYMENLNSNLVDLVLSGHTHGGQITLLGLWAPIMPSSMHPEYLQTGQKYRYGWKEKDNIRVYITSGIGMGGFPFRFFAPPEIVEFTLSNK